MKEYTLHTSFAFYASYSTFEESWTENMWF
jgi:hypothetical protein